ncbi:MAG TPA: hypothetical protein VIG24_17105 [Acidimicrobiia bacterium]
MSILDLRDGLAARLQTISGLRVSDVMVDAPRPPQAVVAPLRVDYDLNARRGADTYQFVVTVMVSRADSRSAQDQLDAYVVGANSVKAAIEADRTLGGKANTCRVIEMRNYGAIAFGDQLYLGCEFLVEVTE